MIGPNPRANSALRGELSFENYDAKPISTLQVSKSDFLVMEFVRADAGEMSIPISRIQFSNERGDVIAYTPTRITALPFCFSKNTCWIFMWKTVYPLPAIFKLDLDGGNLNKDEDPPMIYSRSGNDGKGFTDVTNPLFGLVGLYLFYVKHIAYFGLLILVMVILCAKTMKYYDLPDSKKSRIGRAFLIFNFFIPSWLPIEPYIITAFLILVYAMGGLNMYGIPTVLSEFTALIVFLMSCVRIGKSRRLSK